MKPRSAAALELIGWLVSLLLFSLLLLSSFGAGPFDHADRSGHHHHHRHSGSQR
jgi:hypothetical protein